MTHRRLLRVLGSTAAAGLTAALLVPGTASAAPPAGTLIAASADTAIAGSYIVVFKDSASLRTSATVGKAARELSSRHGARVSHTYSSSVRGFAASISESEAREVAADPARRLRAAERKVRASAHADQPPPGAWTGSTRRALPLTTPTPTRNTASERARLHHRHRHPHHPQRLRWPGQVRLRLRRQRQQRRRLQRPRHARRRHRRRHARTAWPRACSSSPSGCSTARAAAPTPASSPASTGSPRTRSSRPWPT